jgi:FG-GAP-like repeat
MMEGSHMASVWTFIRKPSNQRLLTWLGSGGAVAAAGIWAVVTYVGTTGSTATIPFNHLFVDPNPSTSDGSGIALADIDGDGKLDVITADGPTFGTRGQPVVAWYKNPGVEEQGNWTKTIIDSQFGGTDDAQVADIRGNGIMDVITSDYPAGQIVWYENPRNWGGDPAKDPWRKHVIANGFLHDMAVGDVLGNGKLDVVVHGHFGAFNNEPQPTVLYIQNNPDSWTAVTMTNAPDINAPNGQGKGLALANLAGHTDGKLDLVENGYWLEQPADPTDGSAWTAHVFESNAPTMAAVAVVDINGDGRLDIVMDGSDGAPGALAWYEQGSGNPRDTNNWTKHTIDETINSSHNLFIADMNQDGHPDIVFGEGGTKRIGFLLNNGNGSSWTMQLLSRHAGGRPQVGDLGGDGDLDIVGTRDDRVPVDVWYNQSK